MAKVKVDGECYVYALLDTRKPGTFKYGRWKFDYEPFYIGKGHGNRMNDHSIRPEFDYNKFKGRLIQKIIATTGEKPLVVVKKSGMLEEDAFALEIKLIELIGRRDKGKGPLVNLTDGGDGQSGRIVSDAERQERSAIAKARWRAKSKREMANYSKRVRRWTRDAATEKFMQGLKEFNPNIVLLEKYKGTASGRQISVRLECGCEVKAYTRSVTKRTLTCFACDFAKHIKKNHKGIVLLNRPVKTTDLAQFKCKDKGHLFEQGVRCKLYNTHMDCPTCNREEVTRKLNAHNFGRTDCNGRIYYRKSV
jgi:hypothetical protein